MKKYIPFLLTGTLLIGFSSQALAVDSTTSTNSVILTPGLDVITPPVNPRDPTNSNSPAHPIDVKDPNNKGTGNKGPLSIDYASNINFGKKSIYGSSYAYKAKNLNPFVQVTDTRGTGEGWTLNASVTPFAEGGKVLRGALLSFKDGEVKNTNTLNDSKTPVAKDVIFAETSEIYPILTADKNGGKGTWLITWLAPEDAKENNKITLSVPPGIAEADINYSATITWQLANAPH